MNMQPNSFKIQYLPTGTFSILDKDNSFLKTDGVGTCIALHFHNKEKDIIGMAHIAFGQRLLQVQSVKFKDFSDSMQETINKAAPNADKYVKYVLNQQKLNANINEFIKKIQEKSNTKIADFDITLINNKIHHKGREVCVLKSINGEEKYIGDVGQDMIDTVDTCLKENGCNVIHRNVNFEDYGKKYISVVANRGGGIEVYPVARMNMELPNSLLTSTQEDFIKTQGQYKMRYQDLAYNNHSQYLHMLATFQTEFDEKKEMGANFAPPEICSRVKKGKDGQNMNINDYPSRPYRGMHPMI